VIEEMIVEGKVVGGNDIDAGILLELPVSQPKPLTLGEEIGLGDLSTPVGLVGLLEIPKDSDTAISLSAKSPPRALESLNLRESQK
jgi:hypothetical protein